MIFKATAFLQLTFCISSENCVFNFTSRSNHHVRKAELENNFICGDNCNPSQYSTQFRANQFQTDTSSSQHRVLTNRELKVALIIYPPFVTQKTPSKYYGYTIDILKILSQLNGLKIKYCLYMDPIINLLPDMRDGNFDVLGIPIDMLKNRLYAFDYLPSIIEHSLKVTIRRPSFNNRHQVIYDTYLRPFSYSMWISCGLIFIFGKLLICLNNAIIKKQLLNTRRSNFTKGGFRIREKCERIVDLSMYSTFVTILSSYSSFLTAALTVTKYENSYNGIEDLLNANYKISFLQDTAVHHYVKNVKHGIYPKILEASSGNLYNFTGSSLDYELIHKIYSSKTGFLAYDDALTSAGFANCSFVSLKESVHKSFSYLTLSKNSPYREIFAKNILLIRSSGVLQKIKRDNIPTGKRPCDYSQNDVTSANIIEIQNCVTLFMICAIGIILAIVTCSIEILFYKWYH